MAELSEPTKNNSDQTAVPATEGPNVATEQPAVTTGQPALANRTGPGRGRRVPQALTLVAGLFSLVAAVSVLTGWAPELRWLDVRWVLAGGAVALGVLLLAGSLRSPRAPDAPAQHPGEDPGRGPS